MGRPQVSIRLGTTGRGDVEKDLTAIGDVGDAQARRYQASWERASREAEAALERQEKAAARLQSVSQSPIQRQINATTGVGAVQSGNAKAAAAALAAELDRAESEARQLIASIDPLFAAQQRYEAQIARINAVRATGQLTEERYQQLLANEKTVLDQATAAGLRNAQMRGTMRMGMQQLSFQANDVAQQMALGVAAERIFAQQSGQVVQALQIMGGEGNAFLRFLGGPWGLALTTAAVVLTPFIGKLFAAGESVDDLVEKLQKEARQSALTDEAHRAFATTLEGVTEALNKNRDALKGLSEQGKSAAEQALAHAKAQLTVAEVNKFAAQSEINYTRALLERNRESAKVAGMDPRVAGPLLADADAAQGRLDALQAELANWTAAINTARSQVTEAESHMAVEAGMRDGVEAIRRKYEGANGLIEQTRQRLVNEKATSAEIEKQVRLLHDRETTEIKAAQDRDRKAPANAGGTAIFNEQIASFFDAAAKYRGMSETSNKGVLEAFFREANINLDPEKTAWCAAFVNAVLATQGVKGTGSLAAHSFLNFGKDDTKSPQRGDIVVVKSAGSPSGEHVGFLDSIDKAGNVSVLGGNTGNKVASSTFSKSQVLAIRRPPTPAESAALADKAANDAKQAQEAFDNERAQLNQQLLQELGKVALGYENQAAVQMRIAQAEHDREAQQIAANLADGKYGDATSKLAQTRAEELQHANDAKLAAQKAAISLKSYVASLEEQDSKNEQLTQFKIDELEYEDRHARTAKRHLDIQLQIIDLAFEEKESHLKYLIYLAELNGETKKAADLQRELNNLPREKARAQGDARSDEGNKTPFEQYRDSLPGIDQMGDQTQGAFVDGLKKLNEGLDDAIMKSKNFHDLWKNMKAVFHDVAASILKDLIDMSIKMLIIKPLLNLITGAPAFATGTEYAPGGMALVGEHGPELVGLPRGSKVHTAADTRRMMAANDAGPALSLTFQNDFRGADADAVSAINARLDRLQNEMPGLIVSTMEDARSRFIWRARA